MKTYEVSITITGKVTVPENTIRELRIQAVDPKVDGGSENLHRLANEYPTDDEEFTRQALKGMLRSVVRHGIINDIGSAGVGVKIAPPAIEVSTPERVVTQVKEREQIAAERVVASLPLHAAPYGQADSIE